MLKLMDNPRKAGRCSVDLHRFGPEQAEKVRNFHRSFPEYEPTPLAALPLLSLHLGLGGIYVKDESSRFDLDAFKVLGGSWAVANFVANRLGARVENLTFDLLTNPDLKKMLGELTFVTATDGNHGRGVAWTANRLDQKSVVYMPKGTAKERMVNIRALGSDVSITDLSYDDAVRLARKQAEENGWVLMQDTSFEGYDTIPGWIMEGYLTMAAEAVEQLQRVKPTHIFLQAGVGSMAGALTAYFASLWPGEERPDITIVEPDRADCIFRSARDGQVRCVTGDLDTMMAGLACGEPCPLGWEILKEYADHFISMDDACAAGGMRVLGNPLPGDDRVISGESGASTMGALMRLMTDPSLEADRERMGLDEHARVLLFSTEGDTDQENYRRVVWNGLLPNQ